MNLMPRPLLALVLFATAASTQTLVINNFHPQTVVYELRDTDGRAAVVSYIERIRDRFSPGAPILDATTYDDDALPSKVNGVVRLYTLLSEDSRLLRLTSAGLPLRIENGIVRWGDFSAPAAGLRLVFLGRNPFGPGCWVVYAAGTDALLADVHSVFHGPRSYYIYRGDGRGELLREGSYNADFVETPDRLTLSGAQADAAEFFATLEKNHPNLFARVDRPDYDALKRRTEGSLKAMAGNDGSLDVGALADALSLAAAALHDGHTTLYWQPTVNDATARGRRFPPFWLASDNGRFYIETAADPSLAGAELLAVDGVAVDDFLRPALDRISAETRTYRAAFFTANQLSWYFRERLLPRDACDIQIRDAHGVVRKTPVAVIDLAEFRKLAPSHRTTGGPQIEFLDEGRIARLVIPDLVYAADRRQSEDFFDRAFEQIRVRGAKQLILDIRGNGGGDSRMGDYVMGFVRPGASQVNAFHGKTYMLIDHYVFSSAVMLADAFRDSNAGTLIGYETGGTPSHYGYPRTFTLTRSGIEYGVSRTHFNAPRPRPGDDVHGVLPDVPIERALLAPYAAASDPILAFTLARMRSDRAGAK